LHFSIFFISFHNSNYFFPIFSKSFHYSTYFSSMIWKIWKKSKLNIEKML
jgi:hypothetical protein